MEKDIKSRDAEISDLKDKNQKLLDANASLFKQIPSVHAAETKEAEDDEMLQDYSKLLTRLSGLADDMSSYFRRMKQERDKSE